MASPRSIGSRSLRSTHSKHSHQSQHAEASDPAAAAHSSALFELYLNEMHQLPPISRNTVGAVLYSMTVTITQDSCPEEGDDSSKVEQFKPPTTNDYYDKSGQFVQLSTISSQSMFGNLTSTDGSAVKLDEVRKPFIFDADDHFARRQLCESLLASKNNPSPIPNNQYSAGNYDHLMHASADGLKLFEWQAMIRLQISRLLQDDCFPLRPVLSNVERGIKETELLTFTSLCSADLYRSNQLQEFEDMILQQTKALPNFTGAMSAGDGEDGSVLRRKYFRYISAFVFSQLLSKELMTNPVVLKRYYAMTDELLLCLHWPPPNRRNRTDQLRFPWKREGAEAIQELVLDCVTMTPAGKSVVMLKQLNNDSLNPWLTAYYTDVTVGLRLTACGDPAAEQKDISSSFFCHMEDDVRINVFPGPAPQHIKKPDKCGTICTNVIFPNELSVTACTNGDVKITSDTDYVAASIMKKQVLGQYREYPLLGESSRYIGSKASVVRTFAVDAAHPYEKEILHVDGSRDLFLRTNYDPEQYQDFLDSTNIFESQLLSQIPEEVRWITLSADGGVELCKPQHKPDNTEELDWVVVPCILENILNESIDAETKCRTLYYQDGRILTFYPDGTKLVLFPDHTQFIVQPSISMLNITRGKGWPEIEVDMEVDAMCRSHAQGLEVPINKGGERVRVRVGLPDGTSLFVKYDTRVTASTNGSLKIVSRNRTSMLIKDNGDVFFAPSTAWTADDEDLLQKDCKIDDVSEAMVKKVAMNPMLTFSNQTRGLPATAAPPTAGTYAMPSTASKSFASLTSGKMSAKVKSVTTAENKSTKAGSAKTKKVKMDLAASSTASKVMTTVPESAEALHKTVHDLFSSAAEPDATIYVNVMKSTLTIKDYEYNSFAMDLAFARVTHEAEETGSEEEKVVDVFNKKRESPMDVVVLLAGEVPGLKPPAVARYPKPQKLFIINRHGEATEVLSVQDVSVIEHKVRVCPDTYRFDESAHISPSELGPAKQLRYFTQKKILSLCDDSYAFEEVFGTRNYKHVKLPASTRYQVYHHTNINYVFPDSDVDGSESLPRLFETLALVERVPLSQEGYADIIASIKRCEEFRTKRIQSIDRFAVDDPRTPEQIEEEEAVVKRLKQAYKLAKINASKRKEQNKGREDKIDEEDEEDQDEGANSSQAAATKGTASDVSPKKGRKQSTIMEAQNEDEGEDEDDPEQFSDDEDNGENDPEVVLIKSTFEDYATPSHLVGWGGDVLPVNCLQEALIRMFNRFVSQELIDDAIGSTDDVEPGLEELTINEFRAIYKNVGKLLRGEVIEQKLNPELNLSGDMGDWADANDLASEITHGSAYIDMMSPEPPNSPPERKYNKNAPPLNLKNLSFRDSGSERSKPSSPSVIYNEAMSPEGDANSFAAGSAVNIMRKAKSSGQPAAGRQ